MSQAEPSGPDLEGVVADANAVGLPYVVIGGFSVIANGFVRATRLRVISRHGLVDVVRGGLPPLDFETVAREAFDADVGDESAPFAQS
ncbi:MAG: hypothetical protein JJE35_14945 [Thermoleophilia bacterium]|nr:hypothetical protein [Thermoleophilia bacterium]